jgi:hypothetical protein
MSRRPGTNRQEGDAWGAIDEAPAYVTDGVRNSVATGISG